jgi:hypothetical protein
MSWVFRFKTSNDAIVERDEYMQAVDRLAKAGFRIKKDGDSGWKRFIELRAKYAATLNHMASLLATPPAQWIGDRSYLPHRQQRARRRKRANA